MIKGMSNIEVRILNRKNILNVLYRYGAMTKQDIASILGISPPTVSVLVNDLTKKGLVVAKGSMESTGGRRPALIAVVSDGRYAVGLDVSSNDIRLVLITLSGEQMLAKKVSKSFDGTKNYWEDVSEILKDFVKEAHIDEALILGVGISMPQRTQLDEKMIKEEIAELCGFDVEIGNDVKMAALAQVWNRIEPDPAVYISLDKEVGGAIIAGFPEIFFGSKSAGQFGHMTIDNNGRLCNCGQQGCFEACCSIKALEEETKLDVESFFNEVEAGSKKMSGVWEKYLEHLSIAINNLHVIFRSVIIVGGEMSKYIKEYKADLKKMLEARNPYCEAIDYLRISDYGENDSAYGAALSHVSKLLQ